MKDTNRQPTLPDFGPGIETYQVTVDAREYVHDYRDTPKFLALCRECRGYGNCWACPPFSHDTEAELATYRRATIIATKIPIENHESRPLTDAQAILRPVRRQLEVSFRRLETYHNENPEAPKAKAFAFAGKCLYCEECTRPTGKPCRHPDKVRPSLEAYGFDLTATLNNYFHLPLLWGKEGHLPPYLTLIAALFH